MPVDYDLVVIGGSQVARDAALLASQQQARVALVEPPSTFEQAIVPQFQHHSLLQTTADSPTTSSPPWTLGNAYAEERSLSVLATAGIDAIVGEGEFYARPQLGFAVNGRLLRSRAYLLAAATQVVAPNIPGLAELRYWTIASFYRSFMDLPKRLVIIGSDRRGIELAQALTRLGTQVTLITRNPQLLIDADAEAAFLLQACLDAEGVSVLTNTIVRQVRQVASTKQVQLDDQVLETEEILIATRPHPDVRSLNLEAIGVQLQPYRVPVNARLQTTHSRIYACGETAGHPLSAALHDATLAIRNALFLPIHQSQAFFPQAVFTDPPLAQIGLTEAQAKQRYDDRVWVLRHLDKAPINAHIHDRPVGWCKVITRPNGEILGAHLVGTDAPEIIPAIALAQHHKMRLSAFLDFPMLSPTYSEIWRQIAQDWAHRRDFAQRDWLESWFDWRRSWLR